MNDPKRRFFSGDSLQQALVQAANHFHLQPEEIAFHPVEKRHGFVKVRRKVVIEVDPDAPRIEAAAPVSPGAPPGLQSSKPPAAATGSAATRSRGGRSGEDRSSGRGSHGAPAVLPEDLNPAAGSTAAGVAHHRDSDTGGVAGMGIGAEARQAAAGQTAEAGGALQLPGATELEEEPDPWNRSLPSPEPDGSSRQHGRAGGAAGAGGVPGRPRFSRQPRSAPPPGMRDVEDDVDDDLQPAGLGQGLVALPERPRSIAERYSIATGPQAEAAARGIELVLHIAGLSLEAKIYQGEERLEVDLSGPDTDWCFADDGELLMSIEHLLPRIIRSVSGEAVLCRVDCDNFHEIREERLRSLAQKVADEVRLRGRARTLVPMNPADRRIIHVTLADNPAVVTESEGDGYFKRITVRPA